MASAATTSVTDWLQAIGTVAGTVFAAIAAFAAFLLFRHEVRVRRSDEADARAAQARSILVTFANPTASHEGFMADLPVAVNNFSDGVIMDVRFAVRRRNGVRGGFSIHADCLTPQSNHLVTYDVSRSSLPSNEDPTLLFETRVAFTDAHGVRWIRLDREQPKQVSIDAAETSAEAWARHEDGA